MPIHHANHPTFRRVAYAAAAVTTLAVTALVTSAVVITVTAIRNDRETS